MPLWMNREGGVQEMRRQEKRRQTRRRPNESRVLTQTSTEADTMTTKTTKTEHTHRNFFPELPIEGSDDELAFYKKATPPLDNETVKRVHMQVVIVHMFYQHPDITNEELTKVITERFPQSTWMTDSEGRANADRRKYNGGMFRCTDGWHPKKGDEKYAESATAKKPAEADSEEEDE